MSWTRQKPFRHFFPLSMSPHPLMLSVIFSAGFRSHRHHIYPDRRRRLLGCSCHRGWTHIYGRFHPRKWLQKRRDINDTFITFVWLCITGYTRLQRSAQSITCYYLSRFHCIGSIQFGLVDICPLIKVLNNYHGYCLTYLVCIFVLIISMRVRLFSNHDVFVTELI